MRKRPVKREKREKEVGKERKRPVKREKKEKEAGEERERGR